MALNPFVWGSPLAAADAVSRGDFTTRVAVSLKAGTHVALFGPRGTGKSTFLGQLQPELARTHGADAPAWELVRVDLRRAISLPSFVGAIVDGARDHPSLARGALSAFRGVEKDAGISLGVVRMGVRSRGQTLDAGEVLHAQLRALATIAPRVAIAFDEFQRLAHCPGEPLSIIRSAVMGHEHAGRVALVLAGSLRDRLRLMLHSSSEPIWDQTSDLELPDLDLLALGDYLDLRFQATGKPLATGAAERMLELADGHPKRTQQLAATAWDASPGGERIGVAIVEAAFARLAESRGDSPMQAVLDLMLGGDAPQVNEAKALFLLASGASPGSSAEAARYGLHGHQAVTRAMQRLQAQGYVDERASQWRIVDPLFAAWLAGHDPLSPSR